MNSHSTIKMRFEVVGEAVTTPEQILSVPEAGAVDLTFEDTELVFVEVKSGFEEAHGVQRGVVEDVEPVAGQGLQFEAVETRAAMDEAVAVSAEEIAEPGDD